jgi:Zn ribbon nucleic-acid-binding protein
VTPPDGGRITHAEVVCPWCGHIHRDSWDFGDADLVECVACGRPVAVEREVVVYYTARKGVLPEGG